MQPRVTITDVAHAAGVSVATVSRALRGVAGVRPQTLERVRRAATALEYVASASPAAPVAGRTRTVGVVIPVLARWQFTTVLACIERTVHELGYHALPLDLLDTRSQAGAPTRLRLTRNLLWKRVDGLITVNLALTEPEVALIRRLGLPLVTTGHRIPGWPAVRTDPARVVTAEVDHLLRLGHTEIAYVATAPADAPDTRRSLAAFLSTIRGRGLRTPRPWLLGCRAAAGHAAQVALPMLTAANPPTAVVAGCDEIAIGVLTAARRAGLRVPQDLSVVGSGDHAFAESLGLTTIRHDLDAQGRAAASMLVSRISAGPGPRSAETVVVPCRLVERGSTAPPRRAQPAGT
ncbi:MAG TPA: LacI family DNA-binding transcriptional regulator [Kineosporiaceae bacterium]|nr:LacI family DNA-binding transcriptional regulator [Kineosporiaceae bacterium]